jgi:hypothetical protein
MGMVKITDDFLSKEEFNQILEFFTQFKSEDRATYYVSQIMPPDVFTGKYHNLRFSNTLYAGHAPTSNDVYKISSLMNKISARSVMKIKVNFDFCTPTHDNSGMHVDLSGIDLKGLTTGIYYLNTNNGKTRFEDGTEIESVANRYVSFPTSMKHEGISCTDSPFRCLINLNYFQ